MEMAFITLSSELQSIPHFCASHHVSDLTNVYKKKVYKSTPSSRFIVVVPVNWIFLHLSRDITRELQRARAYMY